MSLETGVQETVMLLTKIGFIWTPEGGAPGAVRVAGITTQLTTWSWFKAPARK